MIIGRRRGGGELRYNLIGMLRVHSELSCRARTALWMLPSVFNLEGSWQQTASSFEKECRSYWPSAVMIPGINNMSTKHSGGGGGCHVVWISYNLYIELTHGRRSVTWTCISYVSNGAPFQGVNIKPPPCCTVEDEKNSKSIPSK